MEEIWTSIYFFNQPTNEWIDYRGLYEISNLGRIRSVDRYVRGYNHGKEHKKKIKGTILKLRPNRNGYILAHLSKEGRHRDYSLHRLVYFSFNPGADTSMQVNHIDENITNCKIDNLNLMTAKDNSNYGTRNERIKQKIDGVKKGPMTEENKKKISEGLKKSEKAKDGRKRTAEKISIPIVQLSLDLEYITEFKGGAAEAERELKIPAQSINDCCRGKRKTAGGFKWKYKKEWVA